VNAHPPGRRTDASRTADRLLIAFAFVAFGAIALPTYGIVAALQPSSEFGRVVAAYGGVFIVGSLLWASRSMASGPTAPTCSARSSASPACA